MARNKERRSSAVQFGQMIQSVDTLTEEVRLLREKTDETSVTVGGMKIVLDAFQISENSTHGRISNIEGQLNRGKGMLAGLTMASGAVGAFVASAWHKLFGG